MFSQKILAWDIHLMQILLSLLQVMEMEQNLFLSSQMVVTQNAGEGYTSISLSASTSAAGVSPASLQAVINQSDFTSDQ
jgi:hypothetical protein